MNKIFTIAVFISLLSLQANTQGGANANDNAFVQIVWGFPNVARVPDSTAADDNYWGVEINPVDQETYIQKSFLSEAERKAWLDDQKVLDNNQKSALNALKRRATDASKRQFYADKNLKLTVTGVMIKKNTINELQRLGAESLLDTVMDIEARIQRRNFHLKWLEDLVSHYNLRTKWPANNTPLNTDKISPPEVIEVDGVQVKNLVRQDWAPSAQITWSLAGYTELESLSQQPSSQLLTEILEAARERQAPVTGWGCDVVRAIRQISATAINFASTTKTIAVQVQEYLAANPNFKIERPPIVQNREFGIPDLNDDIRPPKERRLAFFVNLSAAYAAKYGKTVAELKNAYQATARLLVEEAATSSIRASRSSKGSDSAEASGSGKADKDKVPQKEKFQPPRMTLEQISEHVYAQFNVRLITDAASVSSKQSKLFANVKYSGTNNLNAILQKASLQDAITVNNKQVPHLFVIQYKTTLIVNNKQQEFIGFVPVIVRPNYSLDKSAPELGVFNYQSNPLSEVYNPVDYTQYSFGFASSTADQYTLLYGYAGQFIRGQFQRARIGGPNNAPFTVAGTFDPTVGTENAVLIAYRWDQANLKYVYNYKFYSVTATNADDAACKRYELDVFATIGTQPISGDKLKILNRALKEKNEERREQREENRQKVNPNGPKPKKEKPIKSACGEDDSCNGHGTCASVGNSHNQRCTCNSGYILPFCLSQAEIDARKALVVQQLQLLQQLGQLTAEELQTILDALTVSVFGLTRETLQSVADALQKAATSVPKTVSGVEAFLEAALATVTNAAADANASVEQQKNISLSAQLALTTAVDTAAPEVLKQSPLFAIDVEGAVLVRTSMEGTNLDVDISLVVSESESRRLRLLQGTGYKQVITNPVINNGILIDASEAVIPKSHVAVVSKFNVELQTRADSTFAGLVDTDSLASLVTKISFYNGASAVDATDSTNLIQLTVGLKQIAGDNQVYQPVSINLSTGVISVLTNSKILAADDSSVTFTVSSNGAYAVRITASNTSAATSASETVTNNANFLVAFVVLLLSLL